MNRADILLIVILQWIHQFSTQQYMPLFLNYMPGQKCDVVDGENFCYKVEKKCNQCLTNCTVSLCSDDACVDKIGEMAQYHSAAAEYGQYCDEKYRVLRVETMQYIGVFFGTITFGTLSDIFGRRRILLIGLAIGIPIMLASGEINNFALFYLLRLLTGFFNGVTMVVGWAYISELVAADQRMYLRAFATWPTGRMVITIIAYFTRDWRMTIRVLSIIEAPLLLVLYFVLPESHVWLASKGDKKRYDASVDRMDALAGTEYAKRVEVKTSEKKKSNTLAQVKQLFVNPLLRKRILCLFSIWFVTFYTAYSLTLNSDQMLKQGFFVGQFILCAILMCAKMGLGIIDKFVPGMNRRRVHQLAQGISVSCIVVVLILYLLGYKGTLIFTVFYMGASMMIELCADVCYLAVNELMPTEVRGVAAGLVSMVTRLANIATAMSNAIRDSSEAALYIILILVGSGNWLVSFFFLDETKGVDLNDVARDTMNVGESGKGLEDGVSLADIPLESTKMKADEEDD
ncbi:hypothetical protein PFISCL1PPCAC_24902 [Pristionchus fissidentatus]|uniref:Major facilitator superfamily (MFS) profile domain-containing protein n=1 Tax=Pristionchus fissidentatus TaxID=1538716 RepID=A0AAV5WPN9_9BILA|nr:hypothetical protein PFISCL1PPCAC_24902 [Pristionchus fissidentatus]